MLGTIGSYWRVSRGPGASLCFLAPWLVVYEGAAWWLGRPRVDSGAQAAVDWCSSVLGLSTAGAAPALVVTLLLVRRLGTRGAGSWRWRYAGVMLGECLLWALVVELTCDRWGISRGDLAAARWTDVSWGTGAADAWTALVAALGQGIYAVAVAHLILLPLAALVLRRLGCPRLISLASAWALASCAFAGLTTAWAGCYQAPALAASVGCGAGLALVCWWRGFGVAAGTHAALALWAASSRPG